MANSTTNNNEIFTTLPAELRQMVWEFVFEDNRLWLVQSGPRREGRVIRRLISDIRPTGNRPPHPLFYVNHSIANEVRQLWQHRFDGSLQVHDRVPRFPLQAFTGVTHLSLTMDQATQALQVVVPYILPGHHRWFMPDTPLTLHGLDGIQHLDIHWDRPYYLNGPYDQSQRHNQTTLIRLQYFRRPFTVTVHFRASLSPDQTDDREERVLATGTMTDTATENLQILNVLFLEEAEDDTQLQDSFIRGIRRFGWNRLDTFHTNTAQYRATVAAHTFHDYAPLGHLDHQPQINLGGWADRAGPLADPAASRTLRRRWDF